MRSMVLAVALATASCGKKPVFLCERGEPGKRACKINQCWRGGTCFIRDNGWYCPNLTTPNEYGPSRDCFERTDAWCFWFKGYDKESTAELAASKPADRYVCYPTPEECAQNRDSRNRAAPPISDTAVFPAGECARVNAEEAP